MLMLTLGFSTAAVALGLSFYRKYRTRLAADLLAHRYARIADYKGRPIHLSFDYRAEGRADWVAVEAEVDEIFHYGAHYFLKGYADAGKLPRVYKRDRIGRIRAAADASGLGAAARILGVTPGV